MSHNTNYTYLHVTLKGLYELIYCFLTFNGQYFSHIQGGNKLVNQRIGHTVHEIDIGILWYIHNNHWVYVTAGGLLVPEVVHRILARFFFILDWFIASMPFRLKLIKIPQISKVVPSDADVIFSLVWIPVYFDGFGCYVCAF